MATEDMPHDEPSDAGAEKSDNAKGELERTKLALEGALLRRQLSRTGFLIEWLKASAVPAALIGTAITFIVGFLQIRQAEQNRVADRFDKALVRLSSDRSVERLSGVSGLAQFLNDRDERLKLSAYQYLHDTIVLESSDVVQGAILELLNTMQSGTLDQAALDKSLDRAIKQNRVLRRTLERDSQERALSAIKGIARDAKLKDLVIQLPLSDAQERSLLPPERLRYYGVLNAEFYGASPSTLLSLNGTSSLISILVRKGATGRDFTGIFCTNCDFQNVELSGARFDGSALHGSSFARANLAGASFVNVGLSSVNFYGANLGKSTISAFKESNFVGKRPNLVLDCADVRGAKLSLPLVPRHSSIGT